MHCDESVQILKYTNKYRLHSASPTGGSYFSVHAFAYILFRRLGSQLHMQSVYMSIKCNMCSVEALTALWHNSFSDLKDHSSQCMHLRTFSPAVWACSYICKVYHDGPRHGVSTARIRWLKRKGVFALCTAARC